MLQNIPLGTYFPGNSLLHRLQARTKLLVLLWLTVFLAVANQFKWHFTPYVVVVVLTGVSVALSGISPHYLYQRMRLLVLLTILGAFPTLLFSQDRDQQPLYTLGPFLAPSTLVNWATLIYGVLLTVYLLFWLLPIPRLTDLRQRLWFRQIRIILLFTTAVVIALFCFIPKTLRANNWVFGPIAIAHNGVWLLVSGFTVFLVLYAFSLLLTTTTPPAALIEGLTLLLAPCRRLRLPVDDFALMMLLALRFFPTLIEEVEQLIKAQTARGADLANGTIRERLQSLVTLFIPLMQGALRRAADLATALEARGYQVEGRQTLLYEESLSTVDYMVLGVVALVTSGAISFSFQI